MFNLVNIFYIITTLHKLNVCTAAYLNCSNYTYARRVQFGRNVRPKRFISAKQDNVRAEQQKLPSTCDGVHMAAASWLVTRLAKCTYSAKRISKKYIPWRVSL